MAKFECIIPNTYDFDETLTYFHNHIMNSGISASFEDGSDYRVGDTRLSVRVYERYTLMGGNRLSMTMTFACTGEGKEIFASAITSGGGQGVVKIIGWGEDSFLAFFQEAAKLFQGMRPVKTFDPFYGNP